MFGAINLGESSQAHCVYMLREMSGIYCDSKKVERNVSGGEDKPAVFLCLRRGEQGHLDLT